MAVKVASVYKYYNEQCALNNVSFEIGKGEILGFLGPNGAGKSTMMKIITCFLPASSGTVEVCGFDVNKNPLDVKKHIGYLPEHNPLYTDMYVKEYLSFVAKLYKVPVSKTRIPELIEMVGLGVEQHKKIEALSKGYRQRVGLAQAMIHNPDVLILDEPTTGLDPNQIVENRNLIKEIGKEKVVMMSTHIMQEVEAICDRTIIINKGEIFADDNTSSLKTQHQRKLILCEFDQEVSAKSLKTALGTGKVKQISKVKFEIAEDAQKDLRAGIFEFAVANNLKVLEISTKEEQLQDVFQSLTTK